MENVDDDCPGLATSQVKPHQLARYAGHSAEHFPSSSSGQASVPSCIDGAQSAAADLTPIELLGSDGGPWGGQDGNVAVARFDNPSGFGTNDENDSLAASVFLPCQDVFLQSQDEQQLAFIRRRQPGTLSQTEAGASHSDNLAYQTSSGYPLVFIKRQWQDGFATTIQNTPPDISTSAMSTTSGQAVKYNEIESTLPAAIPRGEADKEFINSQSPGGWLPQEKHGEDLSQGSNAVDSETFRHKKFRPIFTSPDIEILLEGVSEASSQPQPADVFEDHSKARQLARQNKFIWQKFSCPEDALKKYIGHFTCRLDLSSDILEDVFARMQKRMAAVIVKEETMGIVGTCFEALFREKLSQLLGLCLLDYLSCSTRLEQLTFDLGNECHELFQECYLPFLRLDDEEALESIGDLKEDLGIGSGPEFGVVKGLVDSAVDKLHILGDCRVYLTFLIFLDHDLNCLSSVDKNKIQVLSNYYMSLVSECFQGDNTTVHLTVRNFMQDLSHLTQLLLENSAKLARALEKTYSVLESTVSFVKSQSHYYFVDIVQKMSVERKTKLHREVQVLNLTYIYIF